MAQDEYDSRIGSGAHSINLILIDADRPLSEDEINAEVLRRRLPTTDGVKEHLYRLAGKVKRRPTQYVVKTPDGWCRLGLAEQLFPSYVLPDTAAEDHQESTGEQSVLSDEDAREIVKQQIRQRRGQDKFRKQLLSRFESTCVVTGCKVVAVLEAAHIRPYRRPEHNLPRNGLLLRADIHTLFDLNLLGIEPGTWEIHTHPKVVETYGRYGGQSLRLPSGSEPDSDAVQDRFSMFLNAMKIG